MNKCATAITFELIWWQAVWNGQTPPRQSICKIPSRCRMEIPRLQNARSIEFCSATLFPSYLIANRLCSFVSCWLLSHSTVIKIVNECLEEDCKLGHRVRRQTVGVIVCSTGNLESTIRAWDLLQELVGAHGHVTWRGRNCENHSLDRAQRKLPLDLPVAS